MINAIVPSSPVEAVRLHGLEVANLTNTDSVYLRTLHTISLKVDPAKVAQTARKKVHMPADLSEVLDAIYDLYDDDQEHAVLLVLNGGGDLVGFKHISTGGQSYAIMDARVIFRNALLLGAASVIVAHNHPSGETKPSKPDIDTTRNLVRAGELVGVQVFDHIIHTHRQQVSLRDMMPELFEA